MVSLPGKKSAERKRFFFLSLLLDHPLIGCRSVGRSSQRRSSRRRVPRRDRDFRIFTEGQAERFGFSSAAVCARMLPTKNGCCVFVFW